MYTVWKYEVEPDFVNQIYDMPIGAVILSFGLDPNDKLCFWVRVNDQAPMEAHAIACVGTGWPLDTVFNERLDKYACFIGTVTHGAYVWHLFDMGGGAASEILEIGTLNSGEEAKALETDNH